MAQLSWMIGLIPDSFFVWVTYVLMIIGAGLYVASKLVSWIPLMSQYKLPAELIGVVVLMVGVYMFGSYGTEMLWRQRVQELEAKIKIAEEKSAQVNTVIETRVITKTKIIKEKAEKQIEYVDRVIKGDTVEITKDMSEEQKAEFIAKQKELEDNLKNCKVPKLIVEELNKAAETP